MCLCQVVDILEMVISSLLGNPSIYTNIYVYIKTHTVLGDKALAHMMLEEGCSKCGKVEKDKSGTQYEGV